MIAAGTTFRWTDDHGDVVARPLAQRQMTDGRTRVVLIDAAERLFVADFGGNGAAGLVVAGPVTAAEALAKAEAVIAGGLDHGSVTTLVTTLAVGLAGTVYRHEADRGTP